MEKENLVIPEIFSRIVLQSADKVALQIKRDSQWQRFTYKDLAAYSLKVATYLIKEGFKKGDVAAIILENRPEWAIIYLGIVYAGLICLPLDPQLTYQEINNLIVDSSAKIMFCSFGAFTEKIGAEIQKRLNKIVVLDMAISKPQNIVSFSDIGHIIPDKTLLPSVKPEDTASLIYTSGTTGQPKGVILTHYNFCSDFRCIDKLNIILPSDNFLSVLPLYHTYAFMVTLLVPLFSGATVTYYTGLKPEELTQIIREARVSILAGVPQLFSLMHKAIFERIKIIPLFLLPLITPIIRVKMRRYVGRSLRFFVSGGARLEPKIARDLSGLLGIKLIEGYGLTETSPVVTLNPPQKIKPGSVGKPLSGIQIKILHPDASGVGEVLIKGPNVMQGYFKRPDLTAEAIKDGWFCSGDLGYQDAEGYLFLVGREKEVIVLSSGKNIYPEELEEYYSQSPYIKEICILARQEEKFGHRIDSLYAVVAANLEYFQQKGQVDIRQKIRWELENLARTLPSYKHIMGFTVIREELPRTVLKKIKRYQVRQKYLEECALKAEIKETVFSEEERKTLNQGIAQKITRYISGQLNKPVYLDSHLEIDLGIDSLTRVELGLGLEALFGVKIPDELLYSISTVKDAIISIQDLMEKSDTTREKEGIQKSWGQILREPPPEATLKKIRLSVRWVDRLLTWLFKKIFLFILRIFWFLKIEGTEYLPSEGPYLICPNHASYLDGFVVFSSLPFRNAINTYFLGYHHIFGHPCISWAIKIARFIPIDTSTHLTEAMQAVAFALSHRKTACIFSEGQRSIDTTVKEFKKGVGILIKELNIPVVPAYIKGSHYSWPRGTRLPRFCPLKIIFGRPIPAKELLGKAKSAPGLDDYEIIARNLREEVLRLAC